MNGMPGCPQLYFGVVDVRDVADLHLRAMTIPAAKGERFIAVSGRCHVDARHRDGAQGAARRRGEEGADAAAAELARASRRSLQSESPPLLPLLGTIRNATSAKARSVLGWTPRPREDAVAATAESLLTLGVVNAA